MRFWNRRRRPLLVAVVLMAVGAGALVSVQRRPAPASASRTSTPVSPSARAHREWTFPIMGWVGGLAADDDDVVAVYGNRWLAAFDPASGDRRWDVEVPGIVNQAPAISRDVIAVAATDGFVAVARADGNRLWELHAEGFGQVGPAGDAMVIATDDGAVAALDARTGALHWHAQFPGAVRAAPVATNDAVAAVWFDPAGPTLRVLDLATGAVRWDAPMPGGGSAPATAGDLVVVGTGERVLVARRWSDGAEAWRVPTAAGFEPQQRPALIAANDQARSVVAADHHGGVVAVDAVTGSVRWSASLGATEVVLRGAPVGAGDLVLIAAEGRRLAALQLADGGPVAVPDPGGYVAGLATSQGRTVLGLRLTDPGRIEAWRW